MKSSSLSAAEPRTRGGTAAENRAPQLNEFTLDNGLRVIHSWTEGSPLATIQVFSNGGSINEKPAQAGLANLTQVLLMQGTKAMNAEQLASAIEDIGASITSYIEPDFSTVGISVLNSNLNRAAELLAEMLADPAFDDKEIEKERVNIIASLKNRKDRIHKVASDAFMSAFYGSHPYAWPDSGKIETVSKFTKLDILKWHKKYYVSNNMLMVIAGNVTLAEAQNAAQKYFALISSGPAAFERPALKSPVTKRIVKASPKFQQAYLMAGYAAPAIGKEDFYALKVLNSLLGGRMTGRLFVELREKLSLAYEVNSIYPSRRETSRFVIYIGLEAKNLNLAKKRIAEIINELKTSRVTAAELLETKNYIQGIYLLERQTIGRRAYFIGWWDAMGLAPDYDDQYLENLMAVTSEDIQKAAVKYFSGSSITVEIMPGNPAPSARTKNKTK